MKDVTRVKTPWRESWIFRAAAVAGIVLFIGYAVSSLVAVTGIDAVARIAHDMRVEKSLGDHLDAIKRVHMLRQELALSQLNAAIPRGLPSTYQPTDAQVRQWVTATDVADLPLRSASISVFDPRVFEDFPLTSEPTQWLDKEHLRVFNKVLRLPPYGLYEEFKAAEDIRQRYQVVGATLQSKIRPTILKYNIIALVVTFLSMVIIFLVLARQFKSQIEDVITGFIRWSESDSNFRFEPNWRGELKMITTQFNVMADEVESNRQRNLYLEKLASWQIIARKIAHEIKNPLTPIQMMVSQLRRRYRGDDAEFAKLLNDASTIITQEINSLTRMVENFSEFARLPQPKFVRSDLAEVASHIVELERHAFPQHTMKFDQQAKTASTMCDPDLLKQAILNLVKNAAEACGDQPCTITVKLSETASHFQIHIIDNGPGIPEEIQQRIFEAYFTTKHTGPNPGMGLGLAMCQKIALDHEGDLRVSSRPGYTEFVISLPKKFSSKLERLENQ